jgi:hypothetical protein
MYPLCRGEYVDSGSVTVYVRLYAPGFTLCTLQSDSGITNQQSQKYYLQSSYFSLCLLLCFTVLGSVFEKADPGRLSETFGLSVERLNGRTDVLNVTLPFLLVFVVC